MLSYSGRGLTFRIVFLARKCYCGILQRKINVSLHCVMLCLCTSQVKAQLLRWSLKAETKDIYIEPGSCSVLSALYCLWAHDHWGRSFFLLLALFDRKLTCVTNRHEKKVKALKCNRFLLCFIFEAIFLWSQKEIHQRFWLQKINVLKKERKHAQNSIWQDILCLCQCTPALFNKRGLQGLLAPTIYYVKDQSMPHYFFFSSSKHDMKWQMCNEGSWRVIYFFLITFPVKWKEKIRKKG